eukprot:11997-Heterococcus_DN1.PRE.1
MTPQMSGIHVTGFMSCKRILRMSSEAEAPFRPSSWRTAPSDSSLLACRGATADGLQQCSTSSSVHRASDTCTRAIANKHSHVCSCSHVSS